MRLQLPISNGASYIFGVFAITIASCIGTASRGEGMSIPANQYCQALCAVVTYVRSEKGWSENSYRIELKSQIPGTLVFWIIHLDDESAINPGGGKSFELYLDTQSYEILRVLHFQ